MSASPDFDWTSVQLVVFDVDGTLYDQRALRLRMASQLALHTMASCSLRTVKVVSAYRRLREQLAEAGCEAFEQRLLAGTAAATGVHAGQVQAIILDWMETRPLPYLRACRYPGLDALFAGLRRHGKTIGILSDYAPRDKLAVLGLAADHLVSASDAAVGRLKPDPRGMHVIMERAGCAPGQTVLIGDRVDRDGIAARRAGSRILIRASRPRKDWPSFARFDDALFAQLLAR